MCPVPFSKIITLVLNIDTQYLNTCSVVYLFELSISIDLEPVGRMQLNGGARDHLNTAFLIIRT